MRWNRDKFKEKLEERLETSKRRENAISIFDLTEIFYLYIK
jgi:hypothetical protein